MIDVKSYRPEMLLEYFRNILAYNLSAPLPVIYQR
jgi:hypothetical protein